MPKTLDAQIDRLFQLPLDEFTAARNALAKNAGKEGTAIRQLLKPPVAAWAVNQLYWSRRDEYEALVEAASAMRQTHKAVIEGRRGDLRAAGRDHEHALDAALKATVVVMKASGQPATDATRHAVLNTLRALPAGDEPGRLMRALTPGGFEMLSGLKPAKRPGQSTSAKAPKPHSTAVARVPAGAKAAKETARAKSERDSAERAVRHAEHQVRRAEFDTARTAREAVKADRRLEDARAGLQQAREELDGAERAAAAAVRAKGLAERTSRDADIALLAARVKLARD